MELNQDRLRKLASELVGALGVLKDLRKLAREEFIADPHKVGSAKYHCIVVIEAAIDMCNHLISKNGWRTPEGYADTFRVMGEVGAFDDEFVKVLTEMVRFRNRLVHIYWEVDDRELHRILREDLSDLDRFLEELGLFIAQDLL